jgi:outer membrane protein assembly factor BamB
MLLCVALALAALAGDTGGYRGPTGNGVFPASGLLREWPTDGPKLLWKANLGEGYAGPTVSGDTVYMPGGTQGVLHAFSLDGAPRRVYPFGSCTWKRWSGTRSTPIIKDGVAICTTPSANIVALDLKTGEQKWQVNAWKGFGDGKAMGWGYPSTPILAGNNIILSPGCRKPKTTPINVAVDIQTGKTAWTTMGNPERDWYCNNDGSGNAFMHNGRLLAACPTWKSINVIDARTGEHLWEDFDEKGMDRTLTPVYGAGYLVYDVQGRAKCVKLNEDGSKYTFAWSRPYGGFFQAVTLGTRLYTEGRPGDGVVVGEGKPAVTHAEGLGPNVRSILCIDIETGKVLASIPRRGAQGHIISADGMLYVVEDAGTSGFWLRLIKPTETGMTLVSEYRHTLKPEDTAALKVGEEMIYSGSSCPVIADGRFFMKYGSFFVFDLRAEAASDGARRDGMGQAANPKPPIKWWREENLQWTATLPGVGASSPVTNGERVFVTCEPNILACVDAATGKVLWQRAVADAKGVTTPIVREGQIFASFTSGALACFDLNGKQLWAAAGEPAADGVSSPVLSEKLLIAQGRKLQAFEAATGKPVWSLDVPKDTNTGTPTKFRLDDANLLATSWGALVRAADGKVLWVAPGDVLQKVCATVNGGVLYTHDVGHTSAYTLPARASEAMALPRLWTRKEYMVGEGGLVAMGGAVYMTGWFGLKAVDARDGTELYTERIGGWPNVPTPGLTMAGGLLYATTGDLTAVVKPDRTYEEVWRYTVKGGAAEPAFAGDRQFLRGGDRLYGIGGETPSAPVRPETVDLKAVTVPAGAPMQVFASDKTPDRWVVAGPFTGRDLTKDYLAGLGGRTAAAPKAGDIAELAGEKGTFRALADADFWTDPRFTNGMKSVDVTAALAHKSETSALFATMVENDAPRYARVKLLTPDGISWNYKQRLDTLTWFAGQPVDEKAVYKLERGAYPLLIQATIGTTEGWGRIWMAPRLVDVTPETERKLNDYVRRSAGWPAYQAGLAQPFVLAP